MKTKDNFGKYVSMALDPIFIGTGGYQLGRVDLTIVREPGTGIPKIPGSTINGIARTYAAMQYNKFPKCAGQGTEVSTHCGESACPICNTFGYIKKISSKNDEKIETFQGLALFKDMQILLFPVYTIYGPVWITSLNILENLFMNDKNLLKYICEIRENFLKEETVLINTNFSIKNISYINLGSFMYDIKTEDKIQEIIDELEKLSIPKMILERMVIVHDNIIGLIINDNLEIRTSVSIDPSTGTAKEHALFTYEAIPRTTVFWFDVVYKEKALYPRVKMNKDPKEVVEKGLELIEYLGLGGMTSRGFGRLRILKINKQTGTS